MDNDQQTNKTKVKLIETIFERQYRYAQYATWLLKMDRWMDRYICIFLWFVCVFIYIYTLSLSFQCAALLQYTYMHRLLHPDSHAHFVFLIHFLS